MSQSPKKLHPCYTLGYRMQHPEDIFAAVDSRGAVLADIRWEANYGDSRWHESKLRAMFGTQYLRLPILGNVNFNKPGESIRIKNLKMGLEALRVCLEYEPVVIMCACPVFEECHRAVVSSGLREAYGIITSELEIVPAELPEGYHYAISIHQPWASLIALGVKKYETRSWESKFRGPLLIHATKNKESLHLVTEQPFYGLLRSAGITKPQDLPLGALLAIGEMVECWPTEDVPFAQESKERRLGDYTPGRYAFELSNMRAFPNPLPQRGYQQLWRCAIDLERAFAVETTPSPEPVTVPEKSEQPPLPAHSGYPDAPAVDIPPPVTGGLFD